jgi:hypothetical protein
MKKGLTVKGSGCIALGHPARPLRTCLPPDNDDGMMTGARRNAACEPSSLAPRRRGMRDTQAAPMPLRERTNGASRRACQQPRDAAGTPWRTLSGIERTRGRAHRCRPTMRFGVYVRDTSRDSVRVGAAALMRRSLTPRSIPLGWLRISDPFHSPTIGPVTVVRRRCGTETAACWLA